eukprot:s1350_g20.t1
MNSATWAAMIEAGDALEQRILGKRLVHSSDALSLQAGGHNTTLVEHAIEQTRGTMFVETLGTMLSDDVDYLPAEALGAAQEAAMRLARRIAARTPERGSSSTGEVAQNMWWHLGRHHGMGNTAEAARSPTRSSRK